MSEKIVQLSDRKSIEEEAGQWLIKLDGDKAPSAEDLDALREWAAQSPVHKEALGDLVSFWGKMNVLTELAVPLGHHEKPYRHFFLGLRDTVFDGGRLNGLGRAAVAAAILVVGIAIGFTTLLRPDPLVDSNGLYATAVGQQQNEILADGSVVQLNTNSQIRVDYSDVFRDIHLLSGEAYFTVAKIAERPFRVYAGNGRVQAVGTAFSVHMQGDVLNVTVTEGRVTLAARNHTRRIDERGDEPSRMGAQTPDSVATIANDYIQAIGTLNAGQRAIIDTQFDDASAGSIKIVDLMVSDDLPEIAKQLSWRNGLLTFSGDSLEDVVTEISRYTSVSIEISDPSVRAIKIGGQFPVGETEAMLDTLEASFGLRVTRLNPERVLLSAAE